MQKSNRKRNKRRLTCVNWLLRASWWAATIAVHRIRKRFPISMKSIVDDEDDSTNSIINIKLYFPFSILHVCRLPARWHRPSGSSYLCRREKKSVNCCHAHVDSHSDDTVNEVNEYTLLIAKFNRTTNEIIISFSYILRIRSRQNEIVWNLRLPCVRPLSVCVSLCLAVLCRIHCPLKMNGMYMCAAVPFCFRVSFQHFFAHFHYAFGLIVVYVL